MVLTAAVSATTGEWLSGTCVVADFFEHAVFTMQKIAQVINEVAFIRSLVKLGIKGNLMMLRLRNNPGEQ